MPLAQNLKSPTHAHNSILDQINLSETPVFSFVCIVLMRPLSLPKQPLPEMSILPKLVVLQG